MKINIVENMEVDINQSDETITCSHFDFGCEKHSYEKEDFSPFTLCMYVHVIYDFKFQMLMFLFFKDVSNLYSRIKQCLGIYFDTVGC